MQTPPIVTKPQIPCNGIETDQDFIRKEAVAPPAKVAEMEELSLSVLKYTKSLESKLANLIVGCIGSCSFGYDDDNHPVDDLSLSGSFQRIIHYLQEIEYHIGKMSSMIDIMAEPEEKD